ncbi:MAG TPA: hypothetical protein VFO52_09940 [Longimicrobiales bacterium]|nr:hypothetical protein [Longimicrobiales bacterium]
MKAGLIYTVLAVAAFAPATLRAQDANATSATQVRATTPQARIDAAMQTAARVDVPVALLESKIAEGKAKNVPLDRIAVAVEHRLEALVRASETMKRADVESATAGELAVAADALEAGVSQNALVKVSSSAPAERRAVAIATLTGLVQLGHASEQALARVSAVVRSNAALANLHAEVASQLRLGGINAAGSAGAAGIVRIQ